MTDSTLEHVRLFVACEVPDDVKDTIGEVIEGLRQKSGTAVRWIKPDGVHVTLKFLGEEPTKKLPAVKLAILKRRVLRWKRMQRAFRTWVLAARGRPRRR